MATSGNYEGTIEVLAPTGGCAVGTMYNIENVVGLCLKAAAAGELAVLKIEGLVEGAPKESATSSQGFAAGDAVYWDSANDEFVNASGTGHVLCGIAAKIAASTDTTMDVILKPQCT